MAYGASSPPPLTCLRRTRGSSSRPAQPPALSGDRGGIGRQRHPRSVRPTWTAGRRSGCRAARGSAVFEGCSSSTRTPPGAGVRPTRAGNAPPPCPPPAPPRLAWAERPCSVPKPSFPLPAHRPWPGGVSDPVRSVFVAPARRVCGAGPSLRAVRALSGEAGCCRASGCEGHVWAVPAAGLPKDAGDGSTEPTASAAGTPAHSGRQHPGASRGNSRPGRAGSARGPCIWAWEGLVDSRSAHGRPAGPLSFPVTVQRAAVAGAERRPRARTVRAPGLSGRLPGPRTCLTVGPSWAHLRPSCTNCCSTQQRARLPKGARRAHQGLCEAPRCRAEEGRRPVCPGGGHVPPRNGLSTPPDNERLLAFRPETVASPSCTAG